MWANCVNLKAIFAKLLFFRSLTVSFATKKTINAFYAEDHFYQKLNNAKVLLKSCSNFSFRSTMLWNKLYDIYLFLRFSWNHLNKKLAYLSQNESLKSVRPKSGLILLFGWSLSQWMHVQNEYCDPYILEPPSIPNPSSSKKLRGAPESSELRDDLGLWKIIQNEYRK